MAKEGLFFFLAEEDDLVELLAGDGEGGAGLDDESGAAMFFFVGELEGEDGLELFGGHVFAFEDAFPLDGGGSRYAEGEMAAGVGFGFEEEGNFKDNGP